MRLTEQQARIIKAQVVKEFGREAKVLLFGSRVDDEALGGDIDLFVETNHPPEQALKAEMALYAGLQRELGEQRIDIIVHRAGSPLQRVHKEALRTGVELE
ncbi:MAG: nucleotidyltransferase domain-containing protein [Gammaproteobacteria bacterium]|nr:nucleotidyltransferase domain-containing protein [Gammaproteobacteria bacterium]